MEQSDRLYTEEFVQAFSQRIPTGNVTYSQTEGTFQWEVGRPEAQQAMGNAVQSAHNNMFNQGRISERQRQLYQGLTQERIREVFSELFYDRQQERQRQIRIWPNRLAEYPLTPAEAFNATRFDNTWSAEINNEPFLSLEQMREHRQQYSDRVEVLRQHMLLARGKESYEQSMREIEAALQKETNKASPYLDFDNY